MIECATEFQEIHQKPKAPPAMSIEEDEGGGGWEG